MVFTGCNPTKHAQKKIARIVKRHPEVLVKDTVMVTGFVEVEKVRVDTVLAVERFETMVHDTIEIVNDRVSVRIYTNTEHDSIFIEAQCDTLRVPFAVPYAVERIVVKELSWYGRNGWWFLPLLLLIIAGIVYRWKSGTTVKITLDIPEEEDPEDLLP